MRIKAVIAVAACVVLAWSHDVPASPNRHRTEVGFAAGETTTSCQSSDPSLCPRNVSNYTPAMWDVLRSTHGALYFDIEYEADFGPAPAGVPQRTDAIPLIRTANRLGVPVVAWVTLPLSEGAFFDEQNAALAPQVVRDFHAWVGANHLDIRDTMLDLEFPTGDQVVTDTLADNLATLEGMAHADIDPAGQCRAMRTYRDTISWAHRHGMTLSGTPISFSVDDLADGNLGLHDALDMPAYAPGMYDHTWVQAYRTEPPVPPGTPADFDFGSGYVAHYYRLAQHYLGPTGQVGIGNVGIPPYDRLAPIITDVRMLAGMGASSVFLFDFDATANAFGTDGVKRIIGAGHQPLTGAALTAAENDVTTEGAGAFQLFGALNRAANVLTTAVTASEGHPQQPNSWPNGCGPMRPAPLR
jgi:hypothetical protein